MAGIGELQVLLGPPALWLFLLFVIPVAAILAFSFARSSGHGEILLDFTTEHFRRAMDPLYLKVLGRSVLVAGLSTLISAALALPAACFIAFSPPRRQKLLVFLPLWTNLLVRLYSFVVILSDGGLLNRALQALSLTPGSLPLLNTSFAVILGFVYWTLPFMIPPIFASLDRMNVSLIEASMDLGAGRMGTFRKIILPQAAPGIAAGLVLCFIPTLGCFIVPDILGGPDTMMVGNLITSQFGPGRNWPFGSALSSLLMVLVMLAISLYLRFFNPASQSVNEKQ